MDAKVYNKELCFSPLFKKARELYKSYSTLRTNSALKYYLNYHFEIETEQFDCGNDIRKIYNDIILKYYPNEVSVKSNLVNHILIKPKNQVTIFELPVGSSRVDLCTFNTSSTAYEIKTDLDNLNRLDKQIQDYSGVFEKIYVVCSLSRLHDIKRIIGSNYGIYIYSISESGTYKFQLIRNATYLHLANPEKQIQLLRKKELSSYFNTNNNLDRTEMTSFILENFHPQIINRAFIDILKKRYQNQWEFLKFNSSSIYEIDYQWFFKNTINPKYIYN